MTPRYPDVLRRADRRRKALTLAGAMLVLPVACSTSDEEAFSTADGEAPADTASATTSANGTGSAPTDTPATGATAAATATTAPTGATAVSTGLFPAGSEMMVSFTYEPTDTSRAKRPYIAVWVEDADGNLVDTIALWFEQSGKGTRWLNHLRQWVDASGGNDTTMSGATRVAGSYTLAWDGTDADGNPVAQGAYTIFVEAAREHGPYSFTSATVSVTDAGFSVALPDDGELSSALAELAV